jgi:molecular chaperone DnaK
MPQVEVTFDIDANGILHVSAKDKKTGKEQRIEIKAGSGLSEEEIQRMVKDAEAHRDEDKKFHELVSARNQADALLHETRKAVTEAGGKVDGSEIAKVEAAIAELDAAIKGDNKAAIEQKTQALAEASASLRAAASAGHAGGAAPEGGASSSAGKAQDDVVDAEFTEVDGDKR